MAEWKPSCKPVAYVERSTVEWLRSDARCEDSFATSPMYVTQQEESDVALYTAAQLAAEVAAAVAKERERAAQVAEHYPRADGWIAEEIAAAIRTDAEGQHG